VEDVARTHHVQRRELRASGERKEPNVGEEGKTNIQIPFMLILEVVLKVVWIVALGKFIGWWG
jgi:hypothetical protein